jgi:CHAD domain
MSLPNESDARFACDRLSGGCESMKKMLAGLLDSQGRVADEVHALRKLGKSLRGGFSLFRLEKSAALEIQAVGRLLSGPRDAVSRFSTWKKLAWNADPKVAAAIAGLLDQHTHSAARRPPPETVEWCVDRVVIAQTELAAAVETGIAETVQKGMEKLEKRTLKRLRRLSDRNEEDFHEARKAVKALLGAGGFLPEGSVDFDSKYHDLAELLGDENDLATLSTWLESHGFTQRFAPDLWKAIKDRRNKLQKTVIKDAEKLLSALPV